MFDISFSLFYDGLDLRIRNHHKRNGHQECRREPSRRFLDRFERLRDRLLVIHEGHVEIGVTWDQTVSDKVVLQVRRVNLGRERTNGRLSCGIKQQHRRVLHLRRLCIDTDAIDVDGGPLSSCTVVFHLIENVLV